MDIPNGSSHISMPFFNLRGKEAKKYRGEIRTCSG